MPVHTIRNATTALRVRERRTLTVLTIAGLLLAGTRDVRTQSVLAALPRTVEAPADNPTTPEKVALGRLLFWDPILAGRKDVACATCHHPNLGYADNLDVSIGVNGAGLGATRRFAPGNAIPFVKRNSQTVINAAFNGIDQSGHYDAAAAPMFWDLRVRGLEAQALEPIKALEEMRGDAYTSDEAIAVVVARLAGIAEYRAAFARTFGGTQPVSADNLARALASFERSLVATNSPFDRHMRGEAGAMTAAQVRGMAQFERAGCANCHTGPMFSDYKAHVLGVPENPKIAAADSGVNGGYAFRTPSLRNLAQTAPYMHSGGFASLDRVINFYNTVRGGRGGGRGGRRGTQNPNVLRGQLDPLLQRVNVRGRRDDLIAFLNALNDDSFDRTIPERVPSGLTPGGSIR